MAIEYKNLEKLKESSPLQELLIKAGVSQKQLGEALGVSSQTVNNWIHGRFQKEPVRLSIKQVKTLCFLLGCSLEEIPDDFGPQPVQQTITDESSFLGAGRRRKRTRTKIP